MPYPNFHACRVASPSAFKEGSFRNIKRGKLQVIIARKKGETTTSTQAIRYPVDSYSEQQARDDCKKQGGRFDPAKK